jgi:spermidine dehydrogenase
LRTSTDTDEKHDVIIVGCGISGLSAAWEYRKSHPNGSVLMLDQHPIFGGEAKQNEFEVDGYHLTAPQGSTGVAYPTDQPPFDEAKPFLKGWAFPMNSCFRSRPG